MRDGGSPWVAWPVWILCTVLYVCTVPRTYQVDFDLHLRNSIHQYSTRPDLTVLAIYQAHIQDFEKPLKTTVMAGD